ncbi:MAG: outer membrane lipoprotein carrier protein LolA [Leptospiraceae bacterium]|nr:outer membrane lipoprotein carrier protein LolA [Leptospiraceae bacterium]MCP5496618.1 outer membrane lipoprotein carrier protein LolA [Leptospiraceae bacterium]
MNSFDSFRANITINGTLSGVLSYKRPNNLHIKFSDGRIISANGSYLWIYSPSRAMAGKQELRGSTGGISGLLSGYTVVEQSGSSIRLHSPNKSYEEIILTVGANNLLNSIRMRPQGASDYIDIGFSGIQTNIGLSSSYFNFHPPSNAQIVENPLNQRE